MCCRDNRGCLRSYHAIVDSRTTTKGTAMKILRRLRHVFFGHRNLKVNLVQQPWTAICDCGFQLRVTEFALGQIGSK